MATQGQQLVDGGNSIAGQDFSNTAGLKGPSTSGQFLAVKQSTATDRNVILASTGGEFIRGILQNKPALGLAADICCLGISKAIAGATITTGQALMTDTSGRMIPATGTNHRVAIALEAGATNAIITVDVRDFGTVA